MRRVRVLFVAALFVALLVAGWLFAARNGKPVSVDYGWGATPKAPLWLALVVAFGAGALVASVLAGFRIVRLRLLLRRYRKEREGLESEIHQLRNLPLADPIEARGREARTETRVSRRERGG